jgi:hypothetical protein
MLVLLHDIIFPIVIDAKTWCMQWDPESPMCCSSAPAPWACCPAPNQIHTVLWSVPSWASSEGASPGLHVHLRSNKGGFPTSYLRGTHALLSEGARQQQQQQPTTKTTTPDLASCTRGTPLAMQTNLLPGLLLPYPAMMSHPQQK